MNTNLRLCGFVLAGGLSTRMGVDKARIEIAGTQLLLRAVNLLKAHVDSVTVLGLPARYEFIRVSTVPDSKPEKGPLAAILTGLKCLASD